MKDSSDKNAVKLGKPKLNDAIEHSTLDAANWISRLFFHWVTPLILLGRKRDLSSEDLPKLSEKESSDKLADDLQIQWEIEKTRIADQKQPRLWLVCAKALKYRIVISGIICFFMSMVRLLNVFMLWMVIKSVETPNESIGVSFGWGAGLLISMLLRTILFGQYEFATARLGFRAQTGMITMLYRKALKLPITASTHTGQIVNLVSNDASCFDMTAEHLHYLWMSPITSILSVVGLYLQLGWSIFVGLALYAISGPAQGWLLAHYTVVFDEISATRDTLISRIGDLLEGIELIKLYAWEIPFENQINKQRDQQLGYLKKAVLNVIGFISIIKATTYLMTLTTFLTFFAMGNELEASKVFTASALFQVISESIDIQFIDAIHHVNEAVVALRRILRFMLLPELEKNTIDATACVADDINDCPDDSLFVFKDASIGWESSTLFSFLKDDDSDETEETEDDQKEDNSSFSSKQTPVESFMLKNITLSVKKNEQLVVVGPTGSGKTTFCMALLQELKPQCGSIDINIKDKKAGEEMRVAYACQEPWILSGTVRENILFEKPYDSERYEKIIWACALEEDLKLLPHGDATFIGERGITLSGGQKARLSLARAVYSQADLYILDDPLSAVDPHVAKHLYEHVICDLLCNSACVLVTHQLQFIRNIANIAVLDVGKLVYYGPPKNLLLNIESMKNDTDTTVFNEFLSELLRHLETDNISGTESAAEDIDNNNDKSNDITQATALASFEIINNKESDARAEKEEEESGSIPFSTYWDFCRAGAPLFVTILGLLIFSAGEAVLTGSSWVLAEWTELPHAEQGNSHNDVRYAVLVVVGSALFFVGNSFIALIILRANLSTFRSMLHTILNAPMHFFHVNPHGRILNRFSKDQADSDMHLPLSGLLALQGIFNTLASIVITCIISPYSTIALVVGAVGFYAISKMFMPANRQIKRIESTARSPVYSRLSESLYGLITIRAYKSQDQFFNQFVIAQNEHSRAYFIYKATTTWRNLYIDFCTWLFAVTVVLLCIGQKDVLEAGFVGLALSQSLSLFEMLQFAVNQCVEVEMEFVSIERILAYTRLPSEPPRHLDPPPSPDWPSKGAIEFRNMSLTYPGTKEPALRNISFDVKSGEKVGIVGRTGAGKSSLLSALFRLTETDPMESVFIDGVPISSVGVHDLRSRITIIPQTPVLFRGSVRFNLDPLGKCTDKDLWDALQIAGLHDKISCFPDKLDAALGAEGESFSMGEKQLISLARAIVRNTQIVVMDEATANVDTATDQRIQRAIRRHFCDTTVLTIAHRLDTVIGAVAQALNHTKSPSEHSTDDNNCYSISNAPENNTADTIGSDRVLVMNAGEICEYGPPEELLLKTPNNNINDKCWLRKMVLDIGPVGQLAIQQLEERQ
ncbi:P-loop containing nucleoside triphosphate hydrolase protein [Syncephalis fuscata]|nr:P-loop containing nucleoside triphosphate hydrolase protein [Syncephalis fuscata]